MVMLNSGGEIEAHPIAKILNQVINRHLSRLELVIQPFSERLLLDRDPLLLQHGHGCSRVSDVVVRLIQNLRQQQ